jgi:ribosomal protein S21
MFAHHATTPALTAALFALPQRAVLQHASRRFTTTPTPSVDERSAIQRRDEEDAKLTEPVPNPSLHERFEREKEAQQSRSPPPPNSTSSRSPPAAPSNGSTNDLLSRFDNDSALDFLNRDAPPRRNRQQPKPAPTETATSPTSSKPSFKDDLAKLIQNYRQAASSNARDPSNRNRGRLDTSQMLSPARPYDPIENSFNLRRSSLTPIDLDPPTFRINPSLGRTVGVDADRNMDLARAFRTLEIKCSTNRVKQDFNKQRFHERPGMKRKRLASERWRRRFKEAFKATVRRVEDMRRKGW